MREYKNKLRGERRSVNFNSKLVATDRWLKNLEHVQAYDEEIFNKGIEWFKSGLSLEDAPENMRNNHNFINGFNKGKRLAEIDNMVYDDGKNFFLNGGNIEMIPHRYIDDSRFIAGYQDALNNSINKKI